MCGLSTNLPAPATWREGGRSGEPELLNAYMKATLPSTYRVYSYLYREGIRGREEGKDYGLPSPSPFLMTPLLKQGYASDRRVGWTFCAAGPLRICPLSWLHTCGFVAALPL